MRNINLELSFSPNKKVSLHFEIGEDFEIPTKTQAKSYVYDLKRLLKDNIIMLSDLEAKIYACYRSNYLQLSSRNSREILKNINSFEDQNTLIFKEYSKGNGSFIFRAIENCYSSVQNSALILKEHAYDHKSFMLKNDMHSLLGHLKNLEKSFETEKRNLDMNFTHRNKNSKVLKLKAS